GVSIQSKTPVQRTGVITGALSYPSDFDFPRMIVCAEAMDSRSIHCTDKRTTNRRSRKVTYRLSVPAGSYYVFATIVNGEAPTADYRGYKAYYSEFVVCGLSVNCPSHAPVKVTVRAGRTSTGIDPGDWYVNN
ncbi:MAG TPA: hypothetical protein VF064_12535, partial [Pyrinomonadaceae bacterium]